MKTTEATRLDASHIRFMTKGAGARLKMTCVAGCPCGKGPKIEADTSAGLDRSLTQLDPREAFAA